MKLAVYRHPEKLSDHTGAKGWIWGLLGKGRGPWSKDSLVN